MPAFMKLGDIKGESLESGHKDWIVLDSMSSPIHRSIPESARGVERSRGSTIAGDVVVTRHLDKSSTKIMEACAKGDPIKEVEIHFCTTVKGKEEPYLKYKLENVLISSYVMSAHGSPAGGGERPSEQLSLNYTKATWTYVVIDPTTGDNKGEVPGKYDFEAGKS